VFYRSLLVTWAAYLPAFSLYSRFFFWVGLKPQRLVVVSINVKDPCSGSSPWSLYEFTRLYLFFVCSCIKCNKSWEPFVGWFCQTPVLGFLICKAFSTICRTLLYIYVSGLCFS